MRTSLLLWNVSFNVRLKVVFIILLLVYSRANLYGQDSEIIFKDDFSQNTMGVNWQPDPYWAISDGVAYNSSDMGTLGTLRSFSAPSYVIETTVKGFSYAYWRQFFFTFGQTDDSTQNAYVIRYMPAGSGYLTLGRATDNIFYPKILDDAVVYPEFEESRWQKFKIARYKSGLIQVYVDKGAGYSSLPLLEAIDSTHQQLGHFGWTLSTQTAPLSFTVDGIEVQTPLIEKPAVLEKPVEDDLIAQVVATSRHSYNIVKLQVGTKSYTDRNYTVTSLPDYLKNASFIQTAMEDRYNTEVEFLATFIKKEAIIYVAYDSRATTLPAWLDSWEKTSDVIITTDSVAAYLNVYSKTVSGLHLYPQAYLLGGNLASPAVGAQANYLVAVVEKPPFQVLEAEEAEIMGARIATDHTGYQGSGFVDYINNTEDYIEWTTQTTLPGTYVLTFAFSNASSAARSLAITVDGKSAGIHSFIPITSWDSWASYSAPQVYLTTGAHKIKATAIGDSGPNMDYLSLSYISSANPEQLTRYSAIKATIIPDHYIPEVRVLAYPNPFENKTTLTYSLPEQAAVCLTVYNQQGQKVKVLVDKVQPAGDYSVPFSGHNLPKGLYLYRLQAGPKFISGKILRK